MLFVSCLKFNLRFLIIASQNYQKYKTTFSQTWKIERVVIDQWLTLFEGIKIFWKTFNCKKLSGNFNDKNILPYATAS